MAAQIAQIAKQLSDAHSKVTVGAKYCHYKSADNLYEVTELGFFKPTGDVCVIYKALYGEFATFIRPMQDWLQDVEFEGRIVPRFIQV